MLLLAFLSMLGCAGAAAALASSVASGGDRGGAGGSPRSRALHDDSVVIDMHADVVYAVAIRGRDFATGDGEWTIARAREGGLDAQFFPLYVPADEPDKPAALKREARIFREMLDGSGGALALVRTTAEIRSRAAAGLLSALLGIEGAEALGDDPAAVEPYAGLGLRYLGLTWNNSNAFADAAADSRDPGGLTDAGRDLVRRCNDDGVMVDLAHASKASFWDAFRASRSPLLVSHAGFAAVHAHHRNVDDLQILALARSGGVVGIVFHSAFIHDLPEGETTAPLDALLAHFDHGRAIGAAGALGLGSDFDGGIHPPAGLATVSDLPVIAAALEDRGWSEDEIRGVLGGNLMRLMESTDAATDEGAGTAGPREWPLEPTCETDLAAKDAAPMTDGLVRPGPTFEPGAPIVVRWQPAGASEPSVLEIWGSPGARFRLAWRGRGLSGGEGTDLATSASGNVRIDIPPGATRADLTVDGASARVDEIVAWAR